MIEINADLKVLAKIKVGGLDYELTEVKFEDIVAISDSDDNNEALLDIIEKSGIPKDVSRKFSPSTLKKIEEVLVGDLKQEKK